MRKTLLIAGFLSLLSCESNESENVIHSPESPVKKFEKDKSDAITYRPYCLTERKYLLNYWHSDRKYVDNINDAHNRKTGHKITVEKNH